MAQITARPRTRPVPSIPAAPPPPSEDTRTLAVLEVARTVLERGWLQDGWYRTAPRPLRERLFGPMPGPERVEGACLVAALVVAGHTGSTFVHVDRDAGPAVDRVWEALQETRDAHREPPAGAVAPVVRRSRMRELVEWNDARGRTRDDVLGLVDRAISRTILRPMR